jgi:GT2 family glycosyltransferase
MQTLLRDPVTLHVKEAAPREVPQADGTGLLRPLSAEMEALDHDQHQRYGAAARLLDRLLGELPTPVRILEVGSNILNLWPHYLDPDRVRVVRCDIDRYDEGPDFICIEPDRPLPFADESFDAVVALEVLEHLSADRRPSFVADCVRVAQQGAVFSCPDGRPEVLEAEGLAAALYVRRHGRPHPLLSEHQRFGLPSEEEILGILRELDFPHAAFPNAPLDTWLAMLLLSENLTEGQAPAELRVRLNQALQDRGPAPSPAYRKVYVCAKTFQATRALEPQEDTTRSEGPALAGALHWLSTIACDALNDLDSDARREVRDLQAKLEVLENDLSEHKKRLTASYGRTHVLQSYAESLTHSKAWKLLAPLRALRQALRPRGFDARALLPWQHLEPVPGEPTRWISTGDDPQFLVPCMLPAGWVRIRLKLTSKVEGRLELYVDSGRGFHPTDCVERLWVEPNEEIDRDCYVRLREPACAFRLDPIDAEGEFVLENVSVTPVPGPAALWQGFLARLRVIREHRQLLPALGRGLKYLCCGNVSGILDRCHNGLNRPDPPILGGYNLNKAYKVWWEAHRLTDADRERLAAEVAALAAPPVISVLMPVFNVAESYLRLAIESVLRQIYPHWELCIADDGSTVPHVRAVLEEYSRRDPRIRVVYRPERGNISAASNAALELVTGDYVALLDHDDELAEQALLRVAQAVAADPGLDMLYTDEDKLEPNGRHVDPFFKPDWSPDFFLTCMYTCHLGVYRTSLVRNLGGFRKEFDTAQDYDLALRLIAGGARVGHIPEILYHWRKLTHSTALRHDAKPQASETARRALVSYLKTVGQKGTVEPTTFKGMHRVRFAVLGRPRVSIVIPTACRGVRVRDRETTFLTQCVESIRRKSTYKQYEIIVVDNADMPPRLQGELERWGVRRVSYHGAFNLASKMNLGAAEAGGEHLLFLNDDIEVISADWMECLLEYSQQDPIAAVGAKLFFPDGRLQHVGVTILDRNPTHPFYGNSGEDIGYFAGNCMVRNFSAVTGACLMTRAEVFRRLGGFNEEFSLNYNDVDYCLRAIYEGRRIVYTPYAQLYHHEAVSKDGVFPSEVELFHQRWGERWGRDPYYNPNLSVRRHDFRIAGFEEE